MIYYHFYIQLFITIEDAIKHTANDLKELNNVWKNNSKDDGQRVTVWNAPGKYISIITSINCTIFFLIFLITLLISLHIREQIYWEEPIFLTEGFINSTTSQ